MSCHLCLSGPIVLQGRLSAREKAVALRVVLAIGDRRLQTLPGADGRYVFTFGSRKRVLHARLLLIGSRGECHRHGHALIVNLPTRPGPIDLEFARAVMAGAFDTEFYLDGLPPSERTAARRDPIGHYLAKGWRRGWRPHRWFDVKWYLRENPVATAMGLEPFTHYLAYGWKMERHPHPEFDNTHWLAARPAALLGDESPLHHLRGRAAATIVPRKPRVATPPEPSAFSLGRPYPIPPARILRERVATWLGRRSTARNRIAVFTSIVGDYDTLRMPEHLSPEVDYFIYTDRAIDGRGVFTVRPLPDCVESDPTRVSRMIKLSPCRWFPDYDVVVYVDANVIIRGDLMPHLKAFLKSEAPLAFVPHPARDCLYEEGVICAATRRDSVEKIVEHLLARQAEGYPPGQGLIEANLYACRPSDPRTRAFFEAWLDLLRNGSRRDQLSANFVLWKQGLRPHALLGAGFNTRNHPDFALVPHGTHDAAAYAEIFDSLADAERGPGAS